MDCRCRIRCGVRTFDCHRAVVLQSLAQSLEKTTAAETAEIAKLQEQLEQARALARTADSELTLNAIQISTHSNLLLLPDTPAAELTKARAASQALAGGLTERLKELAHNRSTVDQLRQQAEEQFRLNEKQLVEIGTAVAREIDAQALQRQLQRINRLLLEKRSLLAAIFETLDLTAGRIEETRKTLLDLVKKFDQALLRLKNDALFQRSASPLSRLSSAQILDETKQLAHHLRRLWPGAYWVARLEEIWQPGELRILSFILLGTIFLTLVFRTRRYFKHLETRPFYRRHVWCCLAAQLLQNSLPLLGVVVFLYAYARSQALYAAYPELRALVQLLVIWLFSRWWLDFLNIRFREAAPGSFPPEAITLLRRLILLARALGFFWVIIGGFLGNTAVILRLLRIVFGFGLAGGILRLLRICIPLWGERLQTDNRWWPALKSAFVALGYTLAGGGLLLDLMGFDQLAYHWYASLGRSAAVLLWGGVTIRVLQEWDSDINGAKAPDAEGGAQTGPPPALVLHPGRLAGDGRNHTGEPAHGMGRQARGHRRDSPRPELSHPLRGDAVPAARAHLRGADSAGHPDGDPPLAPDPASKDTGRQRT